MGNSIHKLAGTLLLCSFFLAATGVATASRDQRGEHERHEYQTMRTERYGEFLLQPEDVLARLRAQGYSDIAEIERERNSYEVKARNADGRWVELYVDGNTGEVLGREYDD